MSLDLVLERQYSCFRLLFSGGTILSGHRHPHTNTHTEYTIYTTDIKRSFVAEEDSIAERKTWQVYCFGIKKLSELNESKEGFFVGEEGEGHSLHVEGPTAEKAREPTVCYEESEG